jgi:hypothetical protein
MDITKYKLGEGELLYIRNWADDPDALYREAMKLGWRPCRNQPRQRPRTLHRSPDSKE